MKIRDFHITGQYPALSVETEIEDESDTGGHSKRNSVRVTIGPWNYVSLLNESQLKSLVHLVYEKQKHQPTEAMKNLTGASLSHASNEELP